MRKHMGYLSQYASFSKQGELLCTQSLTYLLSNKEAQHTFTSFLGAESNSSVDELLTWRAEYIQSDGGRPDLEGCRADGVPIVKIEGKLDAAFGEGQLASYMSELYTLDCKGKLFLLVPRSRYAETSEYAVCHFILQGYGPWQVQNVTLAVITWEDLFKCLGSVTDQGFREDLAQLHAMYRALNGDDMEPLTTDEQVLLWRERETWWVKLVDLSSRQLTPQDSKMLPLGLEKGAVPYCRRYICCNIRGIESYYSVGTRDPFQNHSTPIWLRFHKDTAHFQAIAEQLENSPLATKIVRSGRHIWYPLEVPYNADRATMINDLLEQITQITNVAYQFTIPTP
jgi:hypothetical protein